MDHTIIDSPLNPLFLTRDLSIAAAASPSTSPIAIADPTATSRAYIGGCIGGYSAYKEV